MRITKPRNIKSIHYNRKKCIFLWRFFYPAQCLSVISVNRRYLHTAIQQLKICSASKLCQYYSFIPPASPTFFLPSNNPPLPPSFFRCFYFTYKNNKGVIKWRGFYCKNYWHQMCFLTCRNRVDILLFTFG